MKFFRATVLTVLACGVAGALQAQSVNGVKAVVHDSVVTFYQVQEATLPYMDILQREYRGRPEVLQQKFLEAANTNLERLIERQLVLHDFETAGYQMPESIIDEEVQDRIRSRYGDRAKLTKTLQAEGITYEKFRRQMRDNFIEQALRARNVSSEIMISPHKIEVYYAAHQDDFQVEEQVKLRMIVLPKTAETGDDQTRAMATEILTKIKEGASFAEMAAIYSQGSQRTEGGDWGWVERSVLRKELAEPAFSLPVGQPSDVIETPQADYLMLVEEKRPQHVKPLNEVRDVIERVLLGVERERLQKKYFDKLRQKTFVRYF